MIRITKLNFSVGSFALDDLSLHVRPGEYFVILGPTGSGKTMLVECLCGLNRIDSGRIEIDGRDVTRLEPRHRFVGYLPQDYALFPHRSVRDNIAYGLKTRGLPPAGLREQVGRLMEELDVAHLAGRHPGKLSGGEKQRVALARALAVGPKVLLLDEPVSALDEQTRDRTCRQLAELQRRTGTTVVHVCHNFDEMLSVADRVAVIQEGTILQVGTPRDVFERPESIAVARFVKAGNLLDAVIDEGGVLSFRHAGSVELRPPRWEDGRPPWRPGPVVVMVRPENFRLERKGAREIPRGHLVIGGAVRAVTDTGALVRVHVACGPELEIEVSLGKREYARVRPQPGDAVELAAAPEDVHVLYG